MIYTQTDDLYELNLSVRCHQDHSIMFLQSMINCRYIRIIAFKTVEHVSQFSTFETIWTRTVSTNMPSLFHQQIEVVEGSRKQNAELMAE